MAFSSPEYAAWHNMISRCRNPRHVSYKNYGARGLTVCERWKSSFDAFLADMGRKPDPKLTLDRIDNDKGYEPGNCRWVTRRESLANRRLYKGGVMLDGERVSLQEAMKRYGIVDRASVYYRVKTHGMSLEEAIKRGPSLWR